MDQIAFVFAGQGAQYPGMGRSLYERNAASAAVLDRLEQLRPGTLDQCFSAKPEDLARTDITLSLIHICVTVAFTAPFGEKHFLYPDAFAAFLTLCDPVQQRKMQQLLQERDAARQAARLAQIQAEEARRAAAKQAALALKEKSAAAKRATARKTSAQALSLIHILKKFEAEHK